ncbi:hypothetical protein NHQ30_000170 [Ciborinia camelliae]|nr:hypothetical protein NHQ30_000170 [Ciborinia camelliae]
MIDMSHYICSFLIVLIICLLLIIVLLIQNYVDEKRLITTPFIGKDEAILTAYASVKINSSADDVFSTIISFEKYGSGYSQYTWEDGQGKPPIVGARGLFLVRRFPAARRNAQDLIPVQFHVEGMNDRNEPVVLTLLDPANKKMAAKTTNYPHWLLSSERVQEVVSVKGKTNVCEYRTWITLTGIASYYPLLTAKEELEDVARDAAMELKVFIEARKRKG